ncbi:MAG: AAA family ATPase [Bacilli bacterium]
MKIKIIRDPYDKRKYLYKSSFIDLSNGATVIIGHNGSGKTTLLRQIETYCKDNTIPFIKYDNYGDGGSAAKEHYGFTGDFASLAATSFHSEGEQIFYNFGKIVKKMGAFVEQNKDLEKIFILLDALDSGLDIEGIEQIKSIFNIIMSEREGKETYILITANNYGLIHNMQCYDVVSGEHKLFTDFEDYKKFILKQYEEKRNE